MFGGDVAHDAQVLAAAVDVAHAAQRPVGRQDVVVVTVVGVHLHRAAHPLAVVHLPGPRLEERFGLLGSTVRQCSVLLEEEHDGERRDVQRVHRVDALVSRAVGRAVGLRLKQLQLWVEPVEQLVEQLVQRPVLRRRHVEVQHEIRRRRRRLQAAIAHCRRHDVIVVVVQVRWRHCVIVVAVDIVTAVCDVTSMTVTCGCC